jgi:hypothetical protein
MPTTISISQGPNTVFDMAYGPNPITLNGITTSEDKYVLRVYPISSATPVADIRQTPNQYAKAIFDLQNILQAHVSPPPDDIDSLGVGPGAGNSAHNTAAESFTYTLRVGYEQNGEVTMMSSGYGPFTVFGGSKQYYEVPFNTNYYQSQVSGGVGANCLTVNRVGHALTDVKWLTGPADTGDQINGNLPGQSNVFTINQNIATRNVYRDDLTTVSWFQELDRIDGAPYPARGIEAWKILFFDADGMKIGSTKIIPNTTQFGAGPNANIGNSFGIPSTLMAVTLATGPYNMPGSHQVPATCHHYYVIPVGWTCLNDAQQCDPQTQTEIDCEDLLQAQRFNIIDDKCNDFEHFQFSWYNSLGFKDYFTFTKRVDHMTKTKHNNFLKEAADYNAQTWDVSQEARGYTTYSAKIQDEYSVTSDYMNDDQAKLLQTMFQSADVKVRMADQDPLQWKPINILSTTWNEKTNRKDKLFQYTVRFKIAHNLKAQRG